MYWYNPKTGTSERVVAPSTDEEAIQMLAGDPDSVEFVTEYAAQRHSGMEIETALISVGHEFRQRQYKYLPVRKARYHRPNKSRTRSRAYELLLAVRLQEEGRDRQTIHRP